MPQELLRDVLHTGDASGRARRRASVLPISIAAHALAAAGFVIIPLAAEVELPLIPPRSLDSYIRTVSPPAPPPPPNHDPAPSPRTAAPTSAPTEIAPEPPRPVYPPGPVVEGAPPIINTGESGPPSAGLTGPAAPPVAPTVPAQPKLVRVGSGIREPKKLVHVTPEYPEIARRARIDGAVILEAVLDVTGRVDRVRVLRSVPLLDDAAVKAVSQWRYTPTELNGVPVPVLMTITVQFSLQR
jgi:periplasmic protein TonB